MASSGNGSGRNAGPQLCTAGCGFFGNPGSCGMCSKCFKMQALKQAESHREAMHDVDRAAGGGPATGQGISGRRVPRDGASRAHNDKRELGFERAGTAAGRGESASAAANGGGEASGDTAAPGTSTTTERRQRCFVCRKKVGLTGFSCRCTDTEVFCTRHRYSDQHNCSFDYRKDGAESISKNNPVVKGEKVQRL